MKLPPAVAGERGSVGKVGVALGLPLPPVAQIVLPDHPEWSRHADEGAKIDEQTLDPERAIIRAVDQAAMHPERMAEADRHCRRHDEEEERPRRRNDGR